VVDKSVVEKPVTKGDQGGKALVLPTPSWKPAAPKAIEEVTTQSLARDAELSHLLDTYNSEGSGDLLKAQDVVNSSLSESAQLQGEARREKPLLIPEFITSCRGLGKEDDAI
jgi:hypothetical protein